MNTLKYKGYVGVFTFYPDDEEFHGRVIGLRDVIHFSGRSVEELKQSLQEGVEDYLAACREIGKDPERPYSGQFRVRIAPDIHRKAAATAQAQGMSLNEFVAQAVERAAG